MTTGRTQEIVPPKNDLSSFTCRGKRMLEGGLGVAAPKSSSVKTSNLILTSFVHAPQGPGDKLHLSSTTESDNYCTELGLTEEGG